MNPLIADTDFTLHVGDVRDVLRELEPESVHCVVTSPPYWGLRDYGTGAWEGGDAEHVHETVAARNGRGGSGAPGKQTEGAFPSEYPAAECSCGARRTDRQLGLEPTPEEYVSNMVEVFREVRRVLAPHGTCWLNLGDSYTGGYRGRNDAEGLAAYDSSVGHAVGSLAERTARRDTGAGGNRQPRPVPAGLKPKDLVGIPWRVAQALQAPYYTGKIKDERERIWLAATIEAEGCLFIHKRKEGQSNGQGYERKNATYGAGLEVSSTDRVIVERCLEITGLGSICEQTPAQNARRKQTIYRWNLRSNVCREVIRELYPHMIAKQHEARLLLGCPSSGEEAHKAHVSLKAIHQGLKPCIDFAPPEGMWERGWFLRSEIIWAKLDRTPCPNP